MKLHDLLPISEKESTDEPKQKRQKDESDDEDDINTKKMLEKTDDEIQAEYDKTHLNDELDQVVKTLCPHKV